MARVVIADDHSVVRAGVKQILSEHRDLEVVAEARDALELLSLLKVTRCDLVLLDITMPGRSGLEVLGDLTWGAGAPRVLVLSMHPEADYALRVLKAGAAGYVTKDNAAEELVPAIRKVLSGRRYVSASLAEKLAAELVGDDGAPPHHSLSNREFEIVRQIVAGRTVSEIGNDLCLSPKTVSTYRARALQKLGVTSNVELTRYALKHGLME
ncbi:MAG TPA: response regulator transcription factor [Armatimonadota bacterium]|jgi:DNA-binding NarL/FixJ family response regulator